VYRIWQVEAYAAPRPDLETTCFETFQTFDRPAPDQSCMSGRSADNVNFILTAIKSEPCGPAQVAGWAAEVVNRANPGKPH
jgi:hypothetical protein